MPKRIVLTGGGTGGHVMLNIALIPEFQKRGIEIHYVGSVSIEKELITPINGVYFHTISSGKLRRYISFQNALDVFKVAFAVIQSLFILLRLRPYGVFSKGGYVAVPVAIAARILRIPVITHESDLTPGLATKIIARISKLVLITFEETSKYLSGYNTKWVGAPLRADLLNGSKEKALQFTGLPNRLPIVLITGGSMGSANINALVTERISELLSQYEVIHLTGKGKMPDIERLEGYAPLEYVTAEMADFLAAADMVVGRAGSNSIFEFLQLEKPMLLVPLTQGSRGDQVENAEVFVARGWAQCQSEIELKRDGFIEALNNLRSRKDAIVNAQKSRPKFPSISAIVDLLLNEFNIPKQMQD